LALGRYQFVGLWEWRRALREVALDIQEGADIVMVNRFGLPRYPVSVKTEFRHPTAAYAVSGEYSLVKAASAKGWVE